MDLNACHAVNKVAIESDVNRGGQTNIYLFIELFIYLYTNVA